MSPSLFLIIFSYLFWKCKVFLFLSHVFMIDEDLWKNENHLIQTKNEYIQEVQKWGRDKLPFLGQLTNVSENFSRQQCTPLVLSCQFKLQDIVKARISLFWLLIFRIFRFFVSHLYQYLSHDEIGNFSSSRYNWFFFFNILKTSWCWKILPLQYPEEFESIQSKL